MSETRSQPGPFVRNLWYMAGWSQEFTDTPRARRILDIPLVFWRGEDGVVRALHDRCPHRFAPLSRGTVSGNAIRCGYHGLAFDGAGQCSDSPFGLAVPPGMSVPSFLLEEKYGCIWLWPGERDRADPALIPDFGYHVDPDYRVVRGTSHIKSHFEMVTDNLLDLTHTRFLHPSFGGDAYAPEVSFGQDGDTVYAYYDLVSPPTEFSEGFMPTNGDDVRERDTMRWNAPACMYLHLDLSPASQQGGPYVPQPSTHMVTPETASTCHYFWASGALADAPIDDDFHYEAVKWAFDHEDAPMLEATQIAMEGQGFWDLNPAIIEHDKAAIRARRIMRKRLREEQVESDAA